MPRHPDKPHVSLEDLQVGGADTGEMHPHQHPVFLRWWFGIGLPQLELGSIPVQSSHDYSSAQTIAQKPYLMERVDKFFLLGLAFCAQDMVQ